MSEGDDVENFDGVVLGSGHNSLILQAYLCRAGLTVVCLEQSCMLGGGLRTIENKRLPGFLHNTHSFFHRGVTSMPWFQDLRLADYPVTYIEPELNVALLLLGGASLLWWSDPERTCESFAAFSNRDALELRDWIERFRPIVEEILIPEASSPPKPPAERERWIRAHPDGDLLLEISRLTPLQFVKTHFHHPVLRAGLLFFNGLREIDLRVAGFGHAIPALMASPARAQMCVGGSAELARGLEDAVTQAGGEVRTDSEPARIEPDGRGFVVTLKNGSQLKCDFVVSGINPQQTLGLLGGHAPPAQQKLAAQFRYNVLAPLFALNLALEQPPDYSLTTDDPMVNSALMTIAGLEDVSQFDQMIAAHEAGVIPEHRIMWGATPTRWDTSQAPAGKHTAFMWEKLPYRVAGTNWPTLANRHAEQMLTAWRRHAPNLTEDRILDSFVGTPADITEQFPNMSDGDLLVGSFDYGQVGYDRPFRDPGGYRTGVRKLYLCGGSTHPGGNITGLCGYNAARVVCEDLSIPIWWNPEY